MSESSDSRIIGLKGMYQDYFLDYASYVILERAVPAVLDGLKPVQRRILHSMFEMHDGRYHKVANIIGHTMQYHPHGDAAIGDAMVNIGQKDLLIDCQGNWGDVRTGDSAAASRYIEARLTKFGHEVCFNPQTTEWQLSYDGRKKEPIHLPVKFPLVLAQGVEGIAVGLATKILPHNFIELVEASIAVLQNKPVRLFPDFQTGGLIDVSLYLGGAKGGKVSVRARLEIQDKKNLVIREIPFGVTTDQLIESILKANDKGKIKIKKVVDNTAKDLEILIELVPGTSPDVTIGALYAFTDCEVSISPNACVIIDNKPVFLTVEEILRISTEHTRDLLRQELEIKLSELQEKWLFSSLEKIFIEKRIYHEIEEAESWEEVLKIIDQELKKYVRTPSIKAVANDKRVVLLRDITEEDIIRLTEIKIKRISKYNTFKADEQIAEIVKELEQVNFDLAHLTDYTIKYFKGLLSRYAKGRERRTEITTFDTIKATQVVANNAKLYVDREGGFIGHGLKQGDYVSECSDIDDIIVFRKDGICKVVRIAEKVFVGKDLIHVQVWKKEDDRTTYNFVYLDGGTGTSYVKRFQVNAVTRDKDYDLTKGSKGSKVLYFTSNPNGESEIVTIQLSPGCTAKKKIFDFDFAELDIKGRGAQGNILTKYPVKKVVQKEVGKSTLGATRIWMDEVSGNLNKDERGLLLGAFDTGDLILVITKDGSYMLTDFELTNRYNPKDILYILKFKPDAVISAVYYDGEKGWTMVKRFIIETTTVNQKFSFITEHKNSQLYFVSLAQEINIRYTCKEKGKKEQYEVPLHQFIDVKGWKALGNKLWSDKVENVHLVDPETAKPTTANKLRSGDTIEFDLGSQGTIFDLDE